MKRIVPLALSLSAIATLTVFLSPQPIAQEFRAFIEFWNRNGEDIYNTNKGYVGLGTETPQAKLDVNGAIAISGVEVIGSNGEFVGNGIQKHNAQKVALLRWYEGTSQGTNYEVGVNCNNVVFDGNSIWAVGNAKVTRIGLDGSNLGIFSMGSQIQGAAYDGSNIWVASFGTNTLFKLDATDGTELGAYPVDRPWMVAFDGEHIWATNRLGNSVHKVQVSDGTLLGTYPVGGLPEAVAFDGEHIWVSNGGSDNVTVLDPETGSTVWTIPVGDIPNAMAFDGTHMWVVNQISNDVSKISAVDGLVVGTYPVGLSPRGVVFDAEHIWVSNRSDDTVMKLRLDDGQILETLTVPSPKGMAFDGGSPWVVNDDRYIRRL